MAAPLYTFAVRDAATIRDDMLRCQRNGLIARGVPAPNVTPDSDEYVRAQSLANELAVVEANCVLKADEAMPDTATGEALERRAAPYGLTKRPAGGSVGALIYSTSVASVVTAGLLLTDGAGLTYEVLVSGTYANDDPIPIVAVSKGAATNLAAGVTLRWQNAPAFSAPEALVAPGGLVNGTDAEDEETFRQRYFAVLQVPPNAGGNWMSIVVLTEQASPAIGKAFVYPAIQGGATVHIAVAAAPTKTSKNRDIASVTMSGVIVPTVKGALSEHAEVTTTTVTNVNVDIAFQLTLPDSPTSSPPGPGGGWLDGTAWPRTTGTAPVTITAVTSTTVMTTDATTAPTVGVSRIAWLSTIEWKIYSAIVIGVSGTSGAYVLTLDTPFVGITTGSYIWPQSAKQATYVAALLAIFSLMGPGEKSANASALLRGYRHPAPVTSWPSTIGAAVRKALTDAGSEVEAAEYIYRTDGTNTLTGSTGVLTPEVPGVVTSPPNIYVPRQIGFYRS